MKKAKKAEKTAKFHTAGLFYQALCGSGLGLFHGIRGNYISAYKVGKAGMRALERTMKIRQDLEAAMLLTGIYNYFTGRFGKMTKFLLKLVGLPPGDYKLGLKQMQQAVDMNGPLNYFTRIFAVYLFAPSSRTRQQAWTISSNMIRNYPDNYYGYLLRGYVSLKKRNFRQALADNTRGRSMLNKDPKSYNDIIIEADIFLFDSRIAYCRAVSYRDNKALDFLFNWTKNKKPNYADAPLMACMYLGHLYSLAGLKEKSDGFYQKMQDYDQAQWMKDLGKRYEKRPMGVRMRLAKNTKKKLVKWLKKRKDVKP